MSTETVTLHVWISRLSGAAEDIRMRWPWIRVQHDGMDLHLRTPYPADVTALVTLRGSRPSMSITSGTAPVGTIPEARAMLESAAALCDAMDLVALHVRGIRDVGD